MSVSRGSQRPLYPVFYSIAFFVAFALGVVMLVTDKNLRTNFGYMSSGYFLHWYVILLVTIATVVGGALLVLVRSRMSVKAGVVGSGLIVAIFLGDILTYGEVGNGFFKSPSSFANYLFGVTYYGGDIRFLYDAMLGVYIAAFIAGIVLLSTTRKNPASSAPTPQ
ncbi:MAG: hypothetical protein M1126_02225 [Candidatus Thermoplasmatota archaeon]|nr:hypothetical protein [Candidatus Thermoplasmatota archaeon]